MYSSFGPAVKKIKPDVKPDYFPVLKHCQLSTERDIPKLPMEK